MGQENERIIKAAGGTVAFISAFDYFYLTEIEVRPSVPSTRVTANFSS